MKAVVAVHDVTPFYQKELLGIFSELKNKGVDKYVLLGVADWKGEKNGHVHDFSRNPDCVDVLENLIGQGCELAMHGYDHLVDKDDKEDERFDIIGWTMSKLIANGHAEFQYYSDKNKAKGKIARGMEVFFEAGLLGKIKGLVPPWWQAGSGIKPAAKELGFDYLVCASPAEIFLKQEIPIYWLESGKVDRSYEISFEPEGLFCAFTRGYARFAEMKYQEADVLRVAIHPKDIRNERLFKDQMSLIKRLQDAGREFVVYSDLKK